MAVRTSTVCAIASSKKFAERLWINGETTTNKRKDSKRSTERVSEPHDGDVVMVLMLPASELWFKVVLKCRDDYQC